MTRLHFDATTVDPSVAIEAIPAGKYIACITKSEQKATKAGNGFYLELEFTVLEGEFRNRKVWTRLNLNNPKETVVAIARANLSAICHAIGVMKPEVAEELHNRPLVITVTAKKNDDGEPKNDVRGYAKHERSFAAQPQANAAVPFPTNAAPWGTSAESDIPF